MADTVSAMMLDMGNPSVAGAFAIIAPAVPPALVDALTGALARSVEKSIGKDDARVGSNDDKITFLELETSKMPPRPVFRSAAIQIEPAVHAMARAEVAKAMKE